QVQEWYKSNKDKLGKKIVFRMIQKTYNSSNELQVSRDMKNALAEAYRNFAAAAQKYSDHSSASRGGLVGPLRLDEVARMDPLLAGAVNNLRTGQVSQVFVGQGGYYIVKVENQQTIAIDEVYDQIRGLLMAQNEQAAFAEWIKEQKRRVAVKVFWDGYESK
ncbi:MAG: peptidyl-prolyl cis-trans isomerase, partial [Leptospiraceae bacterium]|nr:peptidyl-prolyl cis-trans isomerase [Leptospiraceae bacterium]